MAKLFSAILIVFLVGCTPTITSEPASAETQQKQTVIDIIPDEPDIIHTDPDLEREYLLMISRIFDEIKHNYVEPVDSKEILENAIRGMIEGLDPHSSYMTSEQFAKMQQYMVDEKYSGIGITVQQDVKTKYIEVLTPLEGSPAQKAGIETGDLIMMVDDIPLDKKEARDAINAISGPTGTIAKLKILRGKKVIKVNVTRAKIDRPIARSEMFDNDIGYIGLETFSQHSVEKFLAELEILKGKLTSDEFRGLVIDLRSNPGGLLTAAAGIVDMFVNDGTIVYTQGRFEYQKVVYKARKSMEIPLDTPIVVLIDERSASASEVVSAALQDMQRATIIGNISYGKGSVQIINKLPNGGAMKITVAKYYTSSGRSVHGIGVTPDIIVELPKDYKRKSYEDIDPQLQVALDILNDKK